MSLSMKPWRALSAALCVIALLALSLIVLPKILYSSQASEKRAKAVTTKRKMRKPVTKRVKAPSAKNTNALATHSWKDAARQLVLNKALGPLVSEQVELAMIKDEIGDEEGFDSPREAMEYYRRQRLPEGEEEIPVEKYFEAIEQMREMPHFSTAENRFAPTGEALRANPEQGKLGAWTALGPGNIGGRTRAMLIHPTNPGVMYAGAVGGGVWKTTNAGQTWTPISDLMANIAVCSLAFDPKNPDVIYAGTGEGNFNSDSIRGAGIFKTTDAGQTWTRLTATAGTTNFFYVNDLWVSTNDSNRVYAATRTGVWRSLDAGQTWTSVLAVTTQGGCMDLAGRTDVATDFLFVACGNLTQGTIYRKTDAATTGTWDAVLSDPGMGRAALAVAPSNQNIVYAVTAAFSGAFTDGLHAFFRSDNAGATGTWVARVRNTDANRVNTGILSSLTDATATECKINVANSFGGQAWYDLAITVDPLDDKRVWVGGIDLVRSDDGGYNWGAAAFAYEYEQANLVYGRDDQMHPDIHGLFFHPGYNGTTNQQLYVTNDGGIWRTENARAQVSTGALAYCSPQNNAVRWRSLNNGYAVTQFYHGSVYPNGSAYLGGTQDNGTPRGSDSGGINRWKQIFLADGGYSAVDFLNPNKLYVSTQGGGFRKSTDNGETFAIATLGIAGSVAFITPMGMDPSDPQRMYTGGTVLNRTDTGMSSWTNGGLLSGVTSSTGGLTAVAAAPTDANVVLVGTSDGSLVRTARALSLSPANPLSPTLETVARPRVANVSWVAFDPANKNIAYATYSTFGGGHVYRTTNGGASWTNIDGTGATGIPDVPAHCIAIDPSNTARLYVGTDVGVFVSLDGGATWAVENTGFANVVTETLAINVVNGVTTMYAFTHGRGAYKVAINLTGCNYNLARTSSSIGAAGGDLSVGVQVAPGGCAWKAESNVSWITVAENTGGSSDGSVSFKVAANNTFTSRIGTVNIAGRSHTVTQAALVDSEAPIVRVITPAALTVSTTDGTLRVAGTASDNGRVASVTWRSDRGLSGTATGTTTWTIAALPLLTGRNVVSIIATDDSGNVSGTATLIVTSTPASVLTTIAGNGTSGTAGNGGPATLANVGNMARLATDAAGNLYIAEFATSRVRRVAPNGIITTIAGTGTAGSSGDGGAANRAQLNLPVGVAVDAAGNIYIADYGNNRVRKVTAATGVITTFAGTGAVGGAGDNGPAASATLNGPEDLNVDKAGNLYICDSLNHRIRKVDATTGVITTVVGTGTAGSTGDNGPAKDARLAQPLSVAFDGAGNMYVLDAGNARIRRVNASDGVIRTVAGTTAGFSGDGGPALNAQFGPNAIQLTLDSAGNLFFTDTVNQRIRRIAADTQTITTVAGSGAAGFTPDGAGAVGALLGTPSGVAIDPAGLLIIGDRTNNRIRRVLPAVAGDTVAPVVAITAPTGAGTFTATSNPIAVTGTTTDNGTVISVRWSNDRGGSGAASGTTAWTIPTVALQPGLNNLTVSAWDISGNAGTAQLAVSYTPTQVVTTIAGTGVQGNAGDGGPGLTALLAQPRGVVVDAAGNVIFADTVNRRVRRISPSGVITAFAGTGELGSSGDGGPATAATLTFPQFLAIDRAGNVYISDQSSHRIRRVSPDGVISTVAGTGEGFGGFGGDGDSAKKAQLNSPGGIAVDARGNLFIADRSNHRVRKVDAGTGEITTVAGSGLIGTAGDGGQAVNADIVQPATIALDAVGNLYIAEPFTQRIRKVSIVDNRITTLAGNGQTGYNGEGILATDSALSLNALTNMVFDRAGDLYFSETGGHRIRKIEMSTGIITTVAGIGVGGFNGDGTALSGTQLSSPSGLTFDAAGNLYFADTINQRIRRVYSSAVMAASNVSAASFAPNLSSEMITTAFGQNLANATVVASSSPLPTALAGTVVRVRDSLNAERLAPLFFVSAGQINYLVPNGTANGPATVIITNANGNIATQAVNIFTVAPGLFSANATGQGVAAAVVLRVKANGAQSYEEVASFDSVAGRYVAVPIDLGPEGDQVFLVAFGTGIRNRSDLSSVKVRLGTLDADTVYAGPQGSAGLDQVNIRLPRNLAGSGDVELKLTADGSAANIVRVTIR